MGKNKGKIKFCYILVILLVIISISVVIYLILHDQKKFNQEQKLNTELTKKLEEKQKEFSIIKRKNEDLNDQINNLKNINKITGDTQKEVFELAKKLEKQIQSDNTKYKIAYLTFDDGPYYLTDKYLEVLKKYNVKATFFTIGAGKEKCYDNSKVSCMNTYKKIVDDGHTIANHTYSHAIFRGLYKSTGRVVERYKRDNKYRFIY